MLIGLNVLHANKENIYPAYVSKNNSTQEKQDSLLMIPIREGWHYLAVKKLSALLRGITSKHHRDFYCCNCFNSFAIENKLELHKKKVCENKDFLTIIYTRH